MRVDVSHEIRNENTREEGAENGVEHKTHGTYKLKEVYILQKGTSGAEDRSNNGNKLCLNTP